MDVSHLYTLVQTLSVADLSSLLHRQAVCRFSADDVPHPVFHEIYVSIAELQQRLMPDVDLAANRWLFQNLTETLDRRVLAYLAAESVRLGRGDFSINVNLSTLLSQEFMNFDAALKTGTRGTILVEIQNIDIFSDLGSFFFVLEFLRERGYRICLDGLTHLTLPFVNREQLGIDLVKINWGPEMAPQEGGRRHEELAAMVARAGTDRVVLCRCDAEDSIEAGRSLGISLFQGRHIDAVLAERRKRRQGPAARHRGGPRALVARA